MPPMLKTADSSASILCVGNTWFPKSPGGAERYVYELAHQWIAQGDRVELCATDLPSQDVSPALLLTNLAATQQPLPQRLWNCHRHFRQRRLVTPDAINLHFALYSFPLLSQFPAHVPITFNFHGPWALESRQEGGASYAVRLKYWLEQSVFRRCDRFIVLSKAFGEILHQAYKVPWEQIWIIPGGVNTTHFQPNLSRQAAREQLGWHRDRPILFTPRRLVHRMGIHQLLTALVTVRQRVPEVWLAIAGKGPLRDDLAQQVEALGLQNAVHFLGYLPDEQLPVAYQAADLTVVPSQSLEGFGLILLESLAAGTPALCTPIGGMPEVVAALNPNLVTETPEAGAIATQLIALLAGTVPLPSRSACRAYACQRFDWAIIAAQVRSVLLGL